MRESLLHALMQILALLTNIKQEEVSGVAHAYVKDYLTRHFSNEYVLQYLQLFDDYLSSYHKESHSQNIEAREKQWNKNQDQIIAICESLNKEIDAGEKIAIYIQLIQFLRKESHIGGQELDLLDILAESLLINEEDAEALKTFILISPLQVKDKNSLILISGNEDDAQKGYKHIYNERQEIIVWFLRVKSTDTFLFRYSGNRNLYLNGHRVHKNRPYIFVPGAVVKTSRMPPVYYGKVAEQFIDRHREARIQYKAIDIESKFNPRQTAIHPFSLLCRSGQMLGIIGGSGTGKTTLLNVMNGNLKLSQGYITINGYDIHAESHMLEGVIGYVPQDDLLIEELTVYENLYYNAKICFSDQNKQQLDEIIDKALDNFDLVEARDLVVGSPLKKILSGGQRKRLNIALELMREPSVLFVDEPTSGLSSMDSEKVMSLLKRQTLKGKLVIINIHQPSSDLYKLLDKLLIIDKGGRIIYNGNPMDAIEYFKREANYVNPEERECSSCGNVKTEQPLRIIEARMVRPDGKVIRERKIKPEEWYQRYKEEFEQKFLWKQHKGLDKKEKLPKRRFKIPSRWQQLAIFFRRDILSKIKDRQYMLITLGEAPALAFILCFFTKYINSDQGGGYIFANNVNLPAYLFMSMIVALFMGLNLSAEEIIKDKKLLQRERFLNLSRSSYLLSKVSIQFIISAIQTISFVLIGNGILEIESMTFSYFLILFSISCFANLLGLNISSGLNSVVSIYILIPLILVPQILFSGVIVDFDKLHQSISSNEKVPLIGNVMVSRWGFEALAVNQYKNNNYEKHFFEDDFNLSTVSYYSTLLIPEMERRNDEAMWAIEHHDKDHLAIQEQILKVNLKALAAYAGLPLQNFIDTTSYTATTYPKVETYLDSVHQVLRTSYRKYQQHKDKRLQELTLELGSKEAVFHLKQNNFNEALAKWVLKKQETKLIEQNGFRYVRKKEPIYMAPRYKNGGAHLFAPFKFIGKLKISTPLFNMLFVWACTALLFVTLYFDLLRGLIHYVERFKLRRNTNRLMKIRT